LQRAGFAPGDRAAIIMTNQPKWLISAYAVFFAGGIVGNAPDLAVMVAGGEAFADGGTAHHRRGGGRFSRGLLLRSFRDGLLHGLGRLENELFPVRGLRRGGALR